MLFRFCFGGGMTGLFALEPEASRNDIGFGSRSSFQIVETPTLIGSLFDQRPNRFRLRQGSLLPLRCRLDCGKVRLTRGKQNLNLKLGGGKRQARVLVNERYQKIAFLNQSPVLDMNFLYDPIDKGARFDGIRIWLKPSAGLE
jgi:hypothetical protein